MTDAANETASDAAADANAPDKPASLRTGADLDAFLDDHRLALVEFYTEGCGLCASMEPVLGLVARTSEAAVATINPRDDPRLIDEHEITSVPTLSLFVDGEEVARRDDGFVGAEELADFVEENA